MLKNLFRNVAIATALALPIISLTPQKAPAQSRTTVEQVMLSYGLTSLGIERCQGANFVYVIVDTSTGKRTYCALPTAEYPAGNYVMSQDLRTINRMGGGAVATAPVPPPTSPYPPPTGVGYPPPVPYGSPTTPVPPYPTVPVATQPPIISANPYYPVPPNVTASVNAFLSSRGLAAASCSASPVVVIKVNGGLYTACAFPSAAYPAGNYSLDIPGL